VAAAVKNTTAAAVIRQPYSIKPKNPVIAGGIFFVFFSQKTKENPTFAPS
jgi:hypothetical protein